MSYEITTDTINSILKDLGKEYRKRGGKSQKAELIIVGGAAILTDYHFRQASQDIDAIIRAGSALQDAANIVEEKYGLMHGWLNADFMHTSSYSPKFAEHSHYYRTFSNCLEVRIVDAPYLAASKMRAGRSYKHDLSDLYGIIQEEKKKNSDFALSDILNAYHDLYGSETPIEGNVQIVLNKAFENSNGEEQYANIVNEEELSEELLKDFETRYQDVLNEGNAEQILKQQKKSLNKKKK